LFYLSPVKNTEYPLIGHSKTKISEDKKLVLEWPIRGTPIFLLQEVNQKQKL